MIAEQHKRAKEDIRLMMDTLEKSGSINKDTFVLITERLLNIQDDPIPMVVEWLEGAKDGARVLGVYNCGVAYTVNIKITKDESVPRSQESKG